MLTLRDELRQIARNLEQHRGRLEQLARDRYDEDNDGHSPPWDRTDEEVRRAYRTAAAEMLAADELVQELEQLRARAARADELELRLADVGALIESGQTDDPELIENAIAGRPGFLAPAEWEDRRRRWLGRLGVDLGILEAPVEHRTPYVGEDAEGARASARIDREEAGQLPTGPHQPGWGPASEARRAELEASAARWEAQAAELEAER